MRSQEDLLRVRVSLYTLIDLDWERIENDPHWETIAHSFDLSDPNQKQDALFRYLSAYLVRERLFAHNFVPCTNGPSDLYITEMEVVPHVGTRKLDLEQGRDSHSTVRHED